MTKIVLNSTPKVEGAKHQPSEYRHIRAWGKLMQSFEYYIVQQQINASQEGAPVNAVYFNDNVGWVTADTVHADVQKDLAQYL